MYIYIYIRLVINRGTWDSGPLYFIILFQTLPYVKLLFGIVVFVMSFLTFWHLSHHDWVNNKKKEFVSIHGKLIENRDFSQIQSKLLYTCQSLKTDFFFQILISIHPNVSLLLDKGKQIIPISVDKIKRVQIWRKFICCIERP